MVKDTNTIQTFRDKWNKNTSPQSSKEQTFLLKVQGNHCRTLDIQNTNIPDVYRLTHSYCFWDIVWIFSNNETLLSYFYCSLGWISNKDISYYMTVLL